MAKKETTRKPRRRLKRTARRSLAAVLMITAIVVAAIPVPENLAVNSRAGETDSAESPVAYEAARLSGSTDNPYVLPQSETDYKKEDGTQDEAALAAAQAQVMARIMQDIDSGAVRPTEIVTTYGGGLYLTWQFLYKPTNSGTGRLLKYNDEFPADSVNLGLRPNAEYFIIHENAYNLYFSNPGALNKNAGPNGEAKSTIQLTGMDNLSETGMFYPANEIAFRLNDMRTGTNRLDEETVKFFETYFAADYQAALTSFKTYWDAYKKAYDADIANNGTVDTATAAAQAAALAAVGGVLPEDLVRKPGDIKSEANRKQFFCEHNTVLQNLPNYSLEIASDRRLTAGGDRVYVAHGDGNVPADFRYKDVDGYLVRDDDTLITAIAYRAFADVHNVKQIEIDSNVASIERSAFENADISKVTFGNASIIGDRAFYGCKRLTEVTFTDTAKTDTIGAEAFYGSGLREPLYLPRHTTTIRQGAFANCLDLKEVHFAENGRDCEIGDFAFYGDTGLATMDFARVKYTRIGKCAFAFALPGGDVMTDFHFPGGGVDVMDDYVLANRQGLQNVYFENYVQKIPVHTFYRCSNLMRVEFSDKCGAASFDPELFKDVTTKPATNDDPEKGFCVFGPENYENSPSRPRVSTWNAVRTDGYGVTYVYERNGEKYYEVALDSDGTRYRYAVNGADGMLISCALIGETSGPIDLVIPEWIGSIKVNSIGTDCFKDEKLRENIRSITIENHSISTIGKEVFQNLPNLEKVWIGDSVTSIGEKAFYGCSALKDVYFSRQTGDTGILSIDDIGENAFTTTGGDLTFHGDIKKGYGPFDWAMEPDNLLRDSDNTDATAVNVCYQSLWDSDEGAHLTVMVDRDTKEITLLDYPKMADLNAKTLRKDTELERFCAAKEKEYYYAVYDNANDSNIQEMRTEYAIIFNAYRQGGSHVPSVTLPDGEVINSGNDGEGYLDALKLRYGPWINPIYCEGSWKDYLSASDDNGTKTVGAKVADFLFEPLVAEAVMNPVPYFDKDAVEWGGGPYNFMENYKLETDPAVDASSLPEYKRVLDAWKFIQATQDICVPEAVTSIDAVAYKGRNPGNYSRYIEKRPVKSMYETTLEKTTPGLFSGYYKDYDGDDDDRETAVRGNDTIKSIELRAVTELPPYAFDSCEQLTKVVMPAVTKVGTLPFRDCGNLTSLTGSEAYPAERGILYERHKDADGNDRYRIVECLLARGRSGLSSSADEMTRQLAVGTISPSTDRLISLLCETCKTDLKDPTVGDAKDEVTIPAIAERAFEGCKDIFTIDLETAQSLKTIPQNCFKDCDNLQQVILPGSVNKIENDAFLQSSPHSMNVTIYGREVDISDTAFMPDTNRYFTFWSYLDSAAKRFTERHPGIGFMELEAYRVWFYDTDGAYIAGPLTAKKGEILREDDLPAAVIELMHKDTPGRTFKEWMTDDGHILSEPIEKDMTIFVAQYEYDGTMVNGKYVVQFVHGRTGQAFSGRGADEYDRYLITPGTSFANNELPTPIPPDNPTGDGYVFLDEYRTDAGEVWTPDTVITRNTTVLALFGQSGGGNTTSGSSTNTSKGTTNTSKKTTSSNSGNTSGNSSNTSSSSSSSTSSSSTSSTSTTSGTSGPGQFTVFVENGSGSGTYTPGTTVIIQASIPAAGMRFDKWTTESNGVTLASVSMVATTFTMPSNNVTVKANYVADNTTAPTGTVGTGNTTNTTGNGYTRVDIDKPGISNRDLATANTNGSTDNFIVKISETDEATRAVAAALTNKYGTLDNILYYAMDISLYDSTGTTKITDTTGLSVDITIPIPDSLVAYGGNNMAGAVINGDQLESLNESFTTINGVPCIRFRATHFSPYTIYVDTGNLVEGMLDVTPKTGDPIHPKWFLSLGLACLSMILFLKRDKKVVVKA